MPTETQTLKLYKVSRRRDLDIATFNAAVLIEADDGLIIREARLAMGGVAPVVMRLPDTEACLTGKPLDESTMREAGEVAYHEIKPLTDVRGTEAYRRQLAANTLLKFYYESAQPVG